MNLPEVSAFHSKFLILHFTFNKGMGSPEFVKFIKEKLGILAQGRKILATGEGYELREAMGVYNSVFDSKKCQIAAQNTHLWDINY
jgi:hypothetical protein